MTRSVVQIDRDLRAHTARLHYLLSAGDEAAVLAAQDTIDQLLDEREATCPTRPTDPNISASASAS